MSESVDPGYNFDNNKPGFDMSNYHFKYNKSINIWQIDQKNREESTTNTLIKEAREILSSAKIIEPPSFPEETQKLAIVVPIHNEWGNGHMIELLNSFSKQTLEKDNFSIVAVVNNTTEAFVATINENNLVVDIIRYLTGQVGEMPISDDLSQSQRERLIQIRDSGLRISAIDLTKGVKRHMGLIRSIGSLYALERSLPDIDMGNIAWMDGDCQIEPEYCEKTINYLTDHPDVNGLFLPFVYYAEGDRETFKTSYQYRFDMTDRYLRTVLFPTVEKGVGGPFMIGKAKIWERIIDNFPPESERDEDFIASKMLDADGKTVFYPDTVVYTADRAYEEGFDAKVRKDLLVDGLVRNEWIDIGVRILGHQMERGLIGNNPSTDQVKEIFNISGITFDSAVINRLALEEFGMEAITGQSMDLSMFKSIQSSYLKEMSVDIGLDAHGYAESVMRFLSHNLAEKELNELKQFIDKEIQREDFLAQELRIGVTSLFNIIKGGNKTMSESAEVLIKKIPWLDEEISNFSGSEEDFLTQLEENYPDIFSLVTNQGSLRQATVIMRGVMLYLYKANIESKEKYPTTYKLWDIMKNGLNNNNNLTIADNTLIKIT